MTPWRQRRLAGLAAEARKTVAPQPWRSLVGCSALAVEASLDACSFIAAFELLDAARLSSKARALTVTPATLLRKLDVWNAPTAVEALVLAVSVAALTGHLTGVSGRGDASSVALLAHAIRDDGCTAPPGRGVRWAERAQRAGCVGRGEVLSLRTLCAHARSVNRQQHVQD